MSQATIPLAANAAVVRASSNRSSQELLNGARSNELFLAVVGPVGAGVGTAANVLRSYLLQQKVNGFAYEVEIIKASDRIKAWATSQSLQLPPSGRKTLSSILAMQDLGDQMRHDLKDNAAVARAVIAEIRAVRAKNSGVAPGEIDGRPRAYIIDSLRHPAEAHLLRKVYQDAFTLVGVVCDPDVRSARLRRELFDFNTREIAETKYNIENFMKRDADAKEAHGQHVTDAFHEADFFVDNSEDFESPNVTAMNEPLRRLVNLLAANGIARPTIAETAMHHAHSAQLRSACLSRQVGAALVDRQGNVIATGTNEVPRSGGGVYGESFDTSVQDFRCAFRETKYCSSNKEQNEIIDELLKDFPELVSGKDRDEVVQKIRKTSLGGLIEFSRAVHAEMDAILSASRTGVSPVGAKLFVSTYPCHYCARHIVSAGIDQVQYIEPYPKSKALKLHCDSITTDVKKWEIDGSAEKQKVLFRPFVGVSPKMYDKVFTKDRSYKNKITGDFRIGEPEWGDAAALFSARYTELEEDLGIL